MIAWFLANMLWGSVVMLFVMAIRGWVATGLGAKPAYALWLLPAARLIMPPLPVLNIWPGLPIFVPRLSAILPSVAGQPLSTHAMPLATPDIGLASTPLPALDAHGLWALAVPMLLALWAVGVVVFILWQCASYRAFIVRVNAGAWIRGAHAGLRLVESGAVDGPLALGLVHRRIVIPTDFGQRYTEQEQRLALDHEAVHHRRGDIWWNHLALGLLALCWFNPVAWLSFHLFRADQELACDATVAAGAAPGTREAYAHALVKSASRLGLVTACPLYNAGQLKRRLKMLKKHGHSRPRTIGGAGTVSMLATLMMALGTIGYSPAPHFHFAPSDMRVIGVAVGGRPVATHSGASRIEPMAPLDGQAIDPPAAQLAHTGNAFPALSQSQPTAAQTQSPLSIAGGNDDKAAQPAAQPDAKAIAILGRNYAIGHGVEQDKARALTLYRQAAEAGDAPAMLTLALAYEAGGLGVSDNAESANWFKRWARTGDDPNATQVLAQRHILP